jgi:hypothetical protein
MQFLLDNQFLLNLGIGLVVFGTDLLEEGNLGKYNELIAESLGLE